MPLDSGGPRAPPAGRTQAHLTPACVLQALQFVKAKWVRRGGILPPYAEEIRAAVLQALHSAQRLLHMPDVAVAQVRVRNVGDIAAVWVLRRVVLE
jgi:hypothetical protein